MVYLDNHNTLGKVGHSGESTHLPAVWPGFVPQLSIILGLNLLLVGILLQFLLFSSLIPSGCERGIGRENPKHCITIQFYYDDGLTRWENENKIYDHTNIRTKY